jgi:glycogen operon protein
MDSGTRAEGPSDDAGISERRQRDQRALMATLLLSRGTPMLTAGDELGRTQRGNNNAYAQDNETTWLDWANADGALIDFVSQLAQLRRAHPAISADRFDEALLLMPRILMRRGRSDGALMAAIDDNSPPWPALYEPRGGTPADRLACGSTGGR